MLGGHDLGVSSCEQAAAWPELLVVGLNLHAFLEEIIARNVVLAEILLWVKARIECLVWPLVTDVFIDFVVLDARSADGGGGVGILGIQRMLGGDRTWSSSRSITCASISIFLPKHAWVLGIGDTATPGVMEGILLILNARIGPA